MSIGCGRVALVYGWTPPSWASNTWPGWKDDAVISSRAEVCVRRLVKVWPGIPYFDLHHDLLFSLKDFVRPARRYSSCHWRQNPCSSCSSIWNTEFFHWATCDCTLDQSVSLLPSKIPLCSHFPRWWGRSDGGGPREAGGVHRATRFVPSWRTLPPGSHAAFTGEHSPETHIAHCLYSPQHTQHCLWAVTTHCWKQLIHTWFVCFLKATWGHLHRIVKLLIKPTPKPVLQPPNLITHLQRNPQSLCTINLIWSLQFLFNV